MVDIHSGVPSSEAVEQFTFRSGERAVTVDQSVIDTGAQCSSITPAIAAALRLEPLRSATVHLADGSTANAILYRCRIAWTIYETQGFFSDHDVLCSPDSTEVLIGYDFLSRHKLRVDTEHHGLVGTAPSAAVPLTGGGYVINPPRGLVREMNLARFNAARPGEILRPHPAWRFTIPAGHKT